MKSVIDLNTWNRKEHFEFFNNFDEPFFGIVADIDCTDALTFCRENQFSFFHFYLYQSLRSANLVEAFRYRIEDGEPVVYDVVHASSTISRPDKTFGFSFISYSDSFRNFSHEAEMETAAVAATSGLRLNKNTSRNDVIHFSVLPWISFKSLTHARHFEFRDSVPKITFGKYYHSANNLLMPVSVNAHHGLMDAFHVALFLDQLKLYLKSPSI